MEAVNFKWLARCVKTGEMVSFAECSSCPHNHSSDEKVGINVCGYKKD